MRAGLLRERVSVQRAVQTTGAAGGRATSWEPVRTVWARIQVTGGRDQEDQGQERASRTMTVTIRRRAGLIGDANAVRLVWHDRGRDRPLDILSAADDERRSETRMICEEGRGGAG